MKTLQAKKVLQPVRDGGIDKQKVSPWTEHAYDLAYACCLVLPVVEGDRAQSQINRGILERQGFRHTCQEGGVGRQALGHLSHAVGWVYTDQLRLRPAAPGSTQEFASSTAHIKDAAR